MQQLISHLILIIITQMRTLVLLFFIFLAQCQSPPPQKGKSVLASIPPYAFFIEKIAGSTVSVKILVPPGADPHIHEPLPSQVVDAGNSSLWIRIGDPFEQKILPVLKA